jgi:hypothetical protein
MTFRRITQFGAGTLALSAVVSLMGLASPLLAADGAASKSAADRDEWHIKELHDRLKITTA